MELLNFAHMREICPFQEATMKKAYRNALRSKALIRQAFIDLLACKDIRHITVVDIVTRADLSRNTFYAHYQDVYAILEELQGEAIAQLHSALEQVSVQQMPGAALTLLQGIARHIEEHKDIYRILICTSSAESSVQTLKQIMIDRVSAMLDAVGIRDKKHFLLFVEVSAAGFISLFQQYLTGASPYTADEIAQETFRITLACLPLYT